MIRGNNLQVKINLAEMEVALAEACIEAADAVGCGQRN